MKTDLEIAQSAKTAPIQEIASNLSIPMEEISCYGNNKAKINYTYGKKIKQKTEEKIILVTAISPTPSGEGKTTMSIGIADALHKLGKKTILALREPSLGPVFGVKGGAAGGGYSQVVPMEDINLHFTGDLHAISAANNLLAAMIDNHIFQGNALGIDPRRISWKRCVDMNDRQLRFLIDGNGGPLNGMPREDGFDITVASEVMAIFCLATDLEDLKNRLAKIVIGYTYNKEPVTAEQIGASGAMAALLKEAFNPNLVQTLEGTPALIHGGPFANIAHGCNSIVATKLATKLADYTVTEAGFGADLGAEKFLDIKCRATDIWPNAVVIVATIRALKHHGGGPLSKISTESIDYLKAGACNLKQHIDNIQNNYQLPVVVAINAFPTDTPEEVAYLENLCEQWNVSCAVSESFTKGGEGSIELAKKIIAVENNAPKHIFLYDSKDSIKAKVEAVCKKIYHADSIDFSDKAKRQIQQYEELGYNDLPICIAKTQYSFSDNPKLLAAPKNFSIHIREIKLSAGAGFFVIIAGNIMTMPGLPPKPAAENITIDNDGNIQGLF